MIPPRLVSQEAGLGKCALHQKLVADSGTPQSRLADSYLYARISFVIHCVSETALSISALRNIYGFKCTSGITRTFIYFTSSCLSVLIKNPTDLTMGSYIYAASSDSFL